MTTATAPRERIDMLRAASKRIAAQHREDPREVVIGEVRCGLRCQHEETAGGYCLQCGRKVRG
jgi:hypothetical protein